MTWAHQPSLIGADSRLIDASSCHEPDTAAASIQDYPPMSIHREDGLVVKNKLRSSIHPSVSMPCRLLDSDISTPTLNPSSSETWNKSIPFYSKTQPRYNNEVKTYDIGAKDGKTEASADSSVEWTDMDFPPLGQFKGQHRAEPVLWANKRMPSVDEELPLFVLIAELPPIHTDSAL